MDGGDVDDVRAFMAVVEAGGFAAASRTLGMSRSAAAKAVARLENKYAVRLLNRTTRSVALTDAGRALYQKGLEIVAVLQETQASLGMDQAHPHGVLRLTVPDAFGRQVILPVLAQYLERWQTVQVEVSFSDAVVNLVKHGFDLAVRIGVTSPDPGLIMRVLRHEPLVLCAAPTYLDQRGTPRRVEDLDLHDLLFHEHAGVRQNWTLRDAEGRLVAARGRSRLRMDSGAALHQMTLAGIGLSLLPRFLVEADLAAGRLRQVLTETTPESVPVVVLYPHRRLLEPKVRHFIDMLADRLDP